jgi:hypothetical protein
MLYKKINVELIVVADEAEAVIGELNGALDLLEERHTVSGGGIETVTFEHSGTRKTSALAHTMAAGETVAVALRTARQNVTRAIHKRCSGKPGFTAYPGMTLIGEPKPDETVIMAAASGPVGSLVGHLSKMAGCRAVGMAGGSNKCCYLKDELGFDAAMDHREPDFESGKFIVFYKLNRSVCRLIVR